MSRFDNFQESQNQVFELEHNLALHIFYSRLSCQGWPEFVKLQDIHQIEKRTTSHWEFPVGTLEIMDAFSW